MRKPAEPPAGAAVSKSPLRLRNTLGGRVEPFVPADPAEVRMYTCGLTVYARGHIGNFRTFVAQDLLRRFLKFKGYRVRQAMNFTDVDDKTIRGANEAGAPLREYTGRFIEHFFADADALAIERVEYYPRATDPAYIAAMIRLVERLLAAGAAYESEGSVYFRVADFPGYGRLSGAAASDRRAGARVDSDEYDKEDAHDFALWKAAKPGDPVWEAPFGPGRPGWHLECSAMGIELLGPSLDLHCGGVDLVFPHHENEIAQSEAATGVPFVRHWFHCEHLLVEGRKMSKSLGNQFTVRDLLEEGRSPASIRYALAGVHYRQQLNFTRAGLGQAEAAIRRVDDFLRRADEAARSRAGSEAPGRPGAPTPPDGGGAGAAVEASLVRFEEALDDDLNASRALAVVFSALRSGNRALREADGVPAALAWAAAIRRMNEVFAVFDRPDAAGASRPLAEDGSEAVSAAEEGVVAGGLAAAEIEELLGERSEARKRRDFAAADRIRDRLAEAGIVVEDSPAGPRWRRR